MHITSGQKRSQMSGNALTLTYNNLNLKLTHGEEILA